MARARSGSLQRNKAKGVERSPERATPPRRSRGRRQHPPTLLILHLDANKLRQDRLHLGQQAAFAGFLANEGLNADVTLADVIDRDQLHSTLAELVAQKRTYDVIVAVGHSNSRGIQIAANYFVEWKAFGEYLKFLEPRRLVLIACQAGQWPSAQDLFLTLKKLRRLYASPVNATKGLAQFMLMLSPVLLEVKAPRATHVTRTQVAAIALTGGQIREWTRSDMNHPDGLLLDLAAKALDPVVRAVPAALREIFTRGRRA